MTKTTSRSALRYGSRECGLFFPAAALLAIAVSIDLKGVLAAVVGGMLGL
jgi:hypothetical protein